MLLTFTTFALLFSIGAASARVAVPAARAQASGAIELLPYPVTVSHSGHGEGFGFTNSDDVQYTATIYVNGVPFQVDVDTGSSDTWIDPASLGASLPPNLISTGYNSTTPYGDQTVSTGPIVLANVTFGPYTVYNQAIMLSINSSADAGTSSNGLIGLAGYIPDGSSIYTSLMNTSFAENGVPIVYNIFEHSPGLPNYMTFLLSRSSGGLTNGGLLTVSEVLSNLKDILKAPLLDSISPINWQTVLDGVYLNGKRLLGGKQYGNSTASPGTTWRRPALLDTGTTRIVAPLSDVEEFYKHIPGASRLQAEDGIALYRVPCETRLNVTLSLSGQLFPLHPIDLVNVAFDDIKDGFICVGTIYHGGDIPMWVLGDSFLHNVYALYGYGTPNTSELKAQSPYMQLLSLTNPARAWEEFETLLFDELLYSADSLVSALAGNATSTTGLAVYTGTTPSVSLIEASVTATAISQPVVTEIGHR